MIIGLATLVGFDAAANMAEEAKDPFRSVPRAIVGSVAAAGVLGMLFLIALTVAITDIPEVTATESPVAAIMADQLGPVAERIFLVAHRDRVLRRRHGHAGQLLTHGLRDGARRPLPRAPADAKVDRRTQTPIPATILPVVLGIALMVALPG